MHEAAKSVRMGVFLSTRCSGWVGCHTAEAVAGLMDSWRDLEAYRASDPNFRHLPPAGMAQWLHYQIVARVKAVFQPVGDSDEGGWCVDPSGMFHLDHKFMQLTFKKLDQDFQRSNYPTAHNDDYWTQALLPGMPRTLKLIVGYQWTDETATAIRRIAVVCPARRGVVWWYGIPALAQRGSRPRLAPQPSTTEAATESAKGLRIKSRKKANDRTAES